MTGSALELFTGDIPARVVAELVGRREIAWDIETSGLDPNADRIATCQLADRDGRVLLVQVGREVPANLARVLADADVRKVFHYAVFDTSFMSRAWKVRPANVACTKVASKLLEPSAKNHSLKTLLANHLGVVIDKGQRLSDWFAASLTAEQIEYAANDVVHLLPLYDSLLGQLEERGLTGLAQECFRHLPARVVLELGGYGDVFAY